VRVERDAALLLEGATVTGGRDVLRLRFRSLLLRGAPDGEHRPQGMKVTRFSMPSSISLETSMPS
jgi:hypothetical protein